MGSCTEAPAILSNQPHTSLAIAPKYLSQSEGGFDISFIQSQSAAAVSDGTFGPAHAKVAEGEVEVELDHDIPPLLLLLLVLEATILQ